MLEMPTEEWKKPTADFHLDEGKLETFDPRAEAELKAILDQIANATQEQLGEIQKNIAEAIGDDPALLEDPTTIKKINAVYKRSQEVLGVDNQEVVPPSETLH